jgi:hypothetical protein
VCTTGNVGHNKKMREKKQKRFSFHFICLCNILKVILFYWLLQDFLLVPPICKYINTSYSLLSLYLFICHAIRWYSQACLKSNKNKFAFVYYTNTNNNNNNNNDDFNIIIVFVWISRWFFG